MRFVGSEWDLSMDGENCLGCDDTLLKFFLLVSWSRYIDFFQFVKFSSHKVDLGSLEHCSEQSYCASVPSCSLSGQGTTRHGEVCSLLLLIQGSVMICGLLTVARWLFKRDAQLRGAKAEW